MNSLFCLRRFPVRKKQDSYLSSGIYGEISLEKAVLGLFLSPFPVFSLLNREFPELSR